MIIGEYSPRRSRGEYSPIITEPEANNCFSINTQTCDYFKKEKKKKHFNAKSSSLTMAKRLLAAILSVEVITGWESEIASQWERAILYLYLFHLYSLPQFFFLFFILDKENLACYNLGQISSEKLWREHTWTCTHKQSPCFPPPPLSCTNVDNVVKNTVQAFGRFLTNIGKGEGGGGGKYGEVNLLQHRQIREWPFYSGLSYFPNEFCPRL